MRRCNGGAHWLARSMVPGLGLAVAVLGAAVLNLFVPAVRVWHEPVAAAAPILSPAGHALHLGAGPAGVSARRSARHRSRRAGRPGVARVAPRSRTVLARAPGTGAVTRARPPRRQPAPDAWRPGPHAPARAQEPAAPTPSPDSAPAAPVATPPPAAVEASVPQPQPEPAPAESSAPAPAPDLAVPVDVPAPTPAAPRPDGPCHRPRPWHHGPWDRAGSRAAPVSSPTAGD